MSGCLTFPATIPVRNVTEAELAAPARASLPLEAAQRLADWFGDGPVDAQSGWRSPRAAGRGPDAGPFCRLGMSGEAYEREPRAWLAA